MKCIIYYIKCIYMFIIILKSLILLLLTGISEFISSNFNLYVLLNQGIISFILDIFTIYSLCVLINRFVSKFFSTSFIVSFTIYLLSFVYTIFSLSLS